MVRLLSVIFALLSLFSITVRADGDEIYKEQYESSGIDEMGEYLPFDTNEFLKGNNLTPENSDWVNNLGVENVFTHILGFIKNGAKTPISVCVVLMGIILISAAIGSNTSHSQAIETTNYATAISAAAIICVPIFSTVTATVNSMKACTVFMTAFIPIFAAVVASSAAITAVSSSAVLLLATQAVNYICNFVIMPLMGGFLGISIASNISPIISKTGIADGIKKISFWIMSLITTVFIGVLSIQTAVNSAADNLTVRTAKFIIGSAVPLAGTVLSESLSTVTASMSLLKSSIGIYAVIALAAIFLPLLAELFLWRVGLIVTAGISDLFSVLKIASLLRSIESMISLLIGIVLLTLAMFVISLAVLISVGKA